MNLDRFTKYVPDRQRAVLKALQQRAYERMAVNKLAYHNAEHVNWMLEELLEYLANDRMVQSTLENPLDASAVIAATLYHDVIYVPLFKGNEEASGFALTYDASEIPGYQTSPIGIMRDAVDQVLDVGKAVNLVYRTSVENHLFGTTSSKEERVLMDLDMLALSFDYPRFQKNQVLLAKEVVGINETGVTAEGGVKEHLNRSTEFLQKFLDKEFIFRDNYFINTYEQKARSNIERFINQIEGFVWQSVF